MNKIDLSKNNLEVMQAELRITQIPEEETKNEIRENIVESESQDGIKNDEES